MNTHTQITSDEGHSDNETHAMIASSLVSRAWDESDGTIEDAAKIMFNTVKHDRAFLQENLPKILEAWCSERVGAYVAKVRLSAWTPPNSDVAQKGDRLRAAFSNALMDFPLPGGKRLGDATRNEVESGAFFYQERATDMAHKSRWLSAVAEKIKGAKTVSQVLTEDHLRTMQEKTNAS